MNRQLATLALLASPLTAWALTGSGTDLDPYLVSDCQDLQDLDTIDFNVVSFPWITIVNDIDCGVAPFNNGGFTPISTNNGTRFDGVINGGGHIIDGLSIHTSGLAGLFTENRADIQDLTLRNVDITSTGDYAGSFAGIGRAANYQNVAVSGTIRGVSAAGGVFGSGQGNNGGTNGTLQLAVLDVNVEVNAGVATSDTNQQNRADGGGIVGTGNLAIVLGVDVEADITVHGGGVAGSAGGLIGRQTTRTSQWTQNRYTGTLTGVSGSEALGGLIGEYPQVSPAVSFNDLIADVTFAGTPALTDPVVGLVVAGHPTVARVWSTGGLVPNVPEYTDVVYVDPANPSPYFDPLNPEYATWDFTNIWLADGQSLPELRQLGTLQALRDTLGIDCPVGAPYDWDNNGEDDGCRGTNVTVHDTATVPAGSIVGDNVIIAQRAAIGSGNTLHNDVIISRNATLGDNNDIGEGTVIGRTAAIGSGNTLGDDSLVMYGALIGDSVDVGTITLGTNATLGGYGALPGAITCPGPLTLARGASIAMAPNHTFSCTGSVIVGPNSTVDAGGQFGDDVRIRKDASLDTGVTLGDSVRIGRDVTIGNGVTLDDNTNVGARAALCDINSAFSGTIGIQFEDPTCP